MRNRMRTAVLTLGLGALGATGIFAAVMNNTMNEAQLVNVDSKGVILEGYDPVAFFTDGKPVLGTSAQQFSYHGAIYWFASAAHKTMFDKDPAKYEPQFGAYCAYAVSIGKTAPVQIETWSIVDGRLLLQHNEKAVRLWKQDVKGNLAKTDRYCPPS